MQETCPWTPQWKFSRLLRSGVTCDISSLRDISSVREDECTTELLADSAFDRYRTWAATLLQSATVAYEYGVSGPFWYAAGATVQIFMASIYPHELLPNRLN